jgi:hypothetical protein
VNLQDKICPFHRESSRKRGDGEYSMKITQSNKSKTQTGDVVDLGDHDDFCDIDNYTCDNDTYMKAEGEKSIKSF